MPSKVAKAAKRIFLLLFILALCAVVIIRMFGTTVSAKISTANDEISGEVALDLFESGDKVAAPAAAVRGGDVEEEAPADEVIGVNMAKGGLLGGWVSEERAPRERARSASKGSKAKEKTLKKTTWKKSVLSSNTSKLMIGDHTELPIQGMEVFAKVDGFRARVLIDFYFYNDASQQYEGTFKVRLPEGASPYFLAFGQSKVSVDATTGRARGEDLYVRWDGSKEAKKRRSKVSLDPKQIMLAREAKWVEPKEARMVPKKRAALAYTETVRRRVDPALMEWAGAGVFNARIFPIAPRKVHRVVLGYDVLVKRAGDDLVFDLGLPRDLPSSQVHVEIAKIPGSTVELTKGAADRESAPMEDGDKVYYHVQDPKVDEIELRIKRAAQHALVGYEQGLGDVFAARVRPELQALDAAKASKQRPALFLVDKSMSSNPEKFQIWLAMVTSILEENRDAIDRFNVVFFDIEARAFKQAFVPNDSKHLKAFKKMANALALEGATDLGAAFHEAERLFVSGGLGEGERADLFLLSDGAITWGEGDAFMLSEKLRGQEHLGALFAYRTGFSGTNTATLSHMTRELGGALFSVVGESEVKTAARAHRSRPYTIKRARVAGGEDVVLAGRPQTLYPGQSLLVAGRGRLEEQGAKLLLDLELDGEPLTVAAPLEHHIHSPLTSRVYGQIAVDQLEELLGSTRPLAEAYARHFRVTGKSTSLLMLESEADYERFDIVPKEDLVLIRQEPVTVAMLKAFDDMAVKLGDAKAALMTWFRELEETPGAGVKIPEEVLAELEQIEATHFVMESSPLECKEVRASTVPKRYRTALKARSVGYDEVTKEAARRVKRGTKGDALRALSSLVEQNPGDGVLARDVGFSALELGLPDHAYFLFERVAQSRPYEPQTWRALALAAAERGKIALATAYFEVGFAGEWHTRFGEFKRILAQDYMRFIIEQAHKAPTPSLAKYLKRRRADLKQVFGVEQADLVVTLTWNTDHTDIDLHVTEPNGDECYYGYRLTRSGGKLTQDVTEGYGPEMYVMEDAPSGVYKVRTKYFASNANRKSARTKVYATIIRDWGRSNERVEERVVTLETNKQMQDIMTIKVR